MSRETLGCGTSGAGGHAHRRRGVLRVLLGEQEPDLDRALQLLGGELLDARVELVAYPLQDEAVGRDQRERIALDFDLQRLDPGDELLCGKLFLEVGQAIAPEAVHLAGRRVVFGPRKGAVAIELEFYADRIELSTSAEALARRVCALSASIDTASAIHDVIPGFSASPKAVHHEANLPTIENAPQAHARLSRAHENQGRTRRHQRAQGEGKGTTRCLSESGALR